MGTCPTGDEQVPAGEWTLHKCIGVGAPATRAVIDGYIHFPLSSSLLLRFSLPLLAMRNPSPTKTPTTRFASPVKIPRGPYYVTLGGQTSGIIPKIQTTRFVTHSRLALVLHCSLTYHGYSI